MRNVGLGHTRQTNTLHGRAPSIINRSQYMCRCLEVVVDMPRLGIGPSSLTGHQAAAKVLLQIVLKAQVHASVSRFIHSKHKTRAYAHTHHKLTPSTDYFSRSRGPCRRGWTRTTAGDRTQLKGHQAVVECIDLSISI